MRNPFYHALPIYRVHASSKVLWREWLSHIGAMILHATWTIYSGHGGSAPAGQSDGGRRLSGVGDTVETQPVDIMGVDAPESLQPGSSPEVPSQKLRESYQRTAPAELPSMATPASVASRSKCDQLFCMCALVGYILLTYTSGILYTAALWKILASQFTMVSWR